VHSQPTTLHPATRPAPTGAAAVLADIADGAEPLSFARAAKLKCMTRDGRARHVSFVHRAADPTKPHPLECATISGVRMTTEAACLRWLAANSGAVPASSASWTPGRARREHLAAAKALATEGF